MLGQPILLFHLFRTGLWQLQHIALSALQLSRDNKLVSNDRCGLALFA